MAHPYPGFQDPFRYHTPHGHVLRCTCCDRYEVAFRTAHVRLDRPHFADLLREVHGLATARWEAGSYAVLRLTPPDAPVEVRLLLTRPDLVELRELLAGAAAMDELDALLQETLGPDPSSNPPNPSAS
ncbi:MAG: hypothetical protein D6685_09440 [Bacteroidetes bacterium]|nr:hypothetical protein AWN76_008720 [Rhodothermaceae bacterium RA]RMH61361.1 MAG: hypothetical protein D6685_09440 [Bacteroidota bacterium]